MNPVFCGYATNCYCPNADGRQTLRGQAAFGGLTPKIIPVNSCLEAAGQLIDGLDSVDGFDCDGILLGNVADRKGRRKKWENGSPFGYTFIPNGKGQTLFASTVEGEILSLLKKFNLVDAIELLDLPQVADWAVSQGLLSREKAKWLKKTQFRSFELLRIAFWIARGFKIPSESRSLADLGVPDVPPCVWYVDHPFGNCKTTLFVEEREKATRFAHLPFYEQLADVPDGSLAWVRGSSGYGGSEQRFLEIVINGGNAARELNLSIGSSLV